MSPTAAEVFEVALSLSPEERVYIATRLLRSVNSEDAARLEALRAAVDVGIAQLDRGEGIELELEAIAAYLTRRGALAAKRAANAPQRIDDTEQTEIDAAWAEEIDSRVDDILSGKVELVDGEETQRIARRMLEERHQG